MSLLYPTKLSLGVVFAKDDVNLRDAFLSEIEGVNLFLAHPNENVGQTGI
jgi:hypothetical protein